MKPLIYLILLISLLLTPVLQAQETSAELTQTTRVEDLLQNMTLAEKAGQVFMVSIYGKNLPEAGADFIAAYHPGAVSLFAYNTDYQPVEEVATLINDMQTVSTENGSHIPLIIAIDHEGGRVRRLVNGVTRFPDPFAFGAVTDLEPVRVIGEITGQELLTVGINMNLAPVADLYTREDLFDKNRVLHRRTMGADPVRVGNAAAAYTQGLADGGVIGVLKHFPGHGGTVDSHQSLPYVEMDATTAYAEPLESFQIAINAGVPVVMVGHLVYTELEPTPDLPASLSPTMIGILRDEFGFEGVIMTDALDMAAIAGTYPIPEAAVLALNAGVDMLTLGPNVSWETQRVAIERVIAAVESGEIPLARLDEAVRHILTLKAAYNLLDWSYNDPATITQRVDLGAAEAALVNLYTEAATLVRDDHNFLPLDPEDEGVAVVYPAIYQDIEEPCRALAPNIEYYGYTFFPETQDYNSVSRLGIDYDKVIIFVEDAYKNLAQRDLVLTLDPAKTVVVALNSPYDWELFPEVSGYLVMYTNHEASQTAACQVLFGAQPFQGQLPIPLGDYPIGTGRQITP